MEDLGKRIFDARRKQHLTLDAVGQYVGVGKSTVRKWENGIIKNMRRDKIKKLSEVLHVSPGYLMGWTNDPEDYGDETPAPFETLSDFERQVLMQLRLLSQEQQRAFLSFLTTLLNNQSP